jgi:hypothetical protein
MLVQWLPTVCVKLRPLLLLISPLSECRYHVELQLVQCADTQYMYEVDLIWYVYEEVGVSQS